MGPRLYKAQYLALVENINLIEAESEKGREETQIFFSDSE